MSQLVAFGKDLVVSKRKSKLIRTWAINEKILDMIATTILIISAIDDRVNIFKFVETMLRYKSYYQQKGSVEPPKQRPSSL